MPIRLAILIASTLAVLPLGAGEPPVRFSDVAPLVTRYCAECHGESEPMAGVALTKYSDQAAVLADRATWRRVVKIVRFGAMPPRDAQQPTNDERDRLVTTLQTLLDHMDCTQPRDPGRVTLRRLNRNEYDNTVRDLLGVDLRLARNFPSDDVGDGFDNIGDVLSLPPLLLEKYVEAAETIARAAIIDSPADHAPRQLRQGKEVQPSGGASLLESGAYLLASNGTIAAEFAFARDGKYVLRVEAGADQAGPDLALAEVQVDGQKVTAHQVRAGPEALAFHDFEIELKAGKHLVAASFANDYFKPDDPDPRNRDRNLYLKTLEVVGPIDLRPEDFPRSHRELIGQRPRGRRGSRDAARRGLATFLPRAFRRPVSAAEVEKYAQFVALAQQQGDGFERGMQVAVAAALVSPHFLFKIEADSLGLAAEKGDSVPGLKTRMLNDHELAVRLSYFLWSSMPDQRLFELAAAGKLHEDQVLAEEVRRMLADEKAGALAENFAGQWLNLRNLEIVAPDPQAFPDFTPDLRRDMARETMRFFRAVMDEDRNVADFLDANFTYVNERLAKHYGVAGVQGEEFRRITLDPRRAGVLTHASILTLTSNPGRTSPVKRGKWIMENILGTPPPNPPANVPNLEVTQKVAPDLPLRKQLEIHRENPSCAVCHREMDAIGVGFENFDPIGRWRDRDGSHAIDASAELPSGQRFSGPAELVHALKDRQNLFVRTLSERMLTYALGRGLEYYDRCAVDRIVKSLSENERRFSVLVTEIVKSEPFRLQRE